MTTSETYESTEQLAPREFRITKMQPGTAIEANFEAIEAKIAEVVEMYSGVVVSLDYLPDAKKDRAWLNSLVKSVEQRRIEAKGAYLEPYNAFEVKVKQLLAPVREASDNLDRQIKVLEEQAKAHKRELLSDYYVDYAGILADAVPFDRIEDPKWLNKTVDLMSAYSAIERIVEKIAADDATLSGLDLSHPIEAKAEFFATLDLSRAIARSKEIDAQIERARRLEEEKAEIEARRKEACAAQKAASDAEAAVAFPECDLPCSVDPCDHTECARDDEEPPAKEQRLDEERTVWRFEITATEQQFRRVMAYLKEQGISGMAKR